MPSVRSSIPGRLRALITLILACAFSALAIGCQPALASADTAQSFGDTGSVQTYTVPAGTNSLQVSATGGSGAGYYQADGGAGGVVNSTIPATPGQTLYIYVGGNGSAGTGYGGGGGYNGGGATQNFAGSGGGATDIRTSQNDLGSRILVAGGGGGAGPGNGAGSDAAGGSAGYPSGNTGSSYYGSPGAGGSQDLGGSGGPATGDGYQGGNSGGLGGGGTGASDGGEGGGGGGGGYYGGGGASGSSGGGGGSDYVEPGAYGTTYSTGGSAGVTITPTNSTIAVGPTQQDFGSVNVGQSSAAQQFTVTNSGSAAADISSVTVSGPNAQSFSVSADTCTGTSVPADGTCTVNLTFTPTAGASASDAEQYAELDVNSDAGVYGASLQGTGMTQPTLQAFVPSANFGTVADGQTQSELITIYNTSSVAASPLASITGDTHSEYSVASGGYSPCDEVLFPGMTPLPGYLPAYSQCQVEVDFTPTTANTQENATLTVANTTSTGGSVSVALTGEGQSLPTISTTTSPVDFGSVNDGTTASQTVTVTNTGDENLTLNASTLSAGSAYSISNDGCNGQSLATNATCTISLSFAPTSPGQQTATLNIPNNDPTQSGTTTINLQGDGVAGALSASPSPLGYGPVPEGQSQTQTVTVSNTGPGTVDIAADTLSGAHAGQFTVLSDACADTTLTASGPGSSCAIAVSYSASTRGSVTAALNISSDASNATSGSTAVALSGTGLAPADISASPTNQDFGQVTEGQDSAPATFTVTNTGDRSLNIDNATITGVDSSQFVIVSGQDNCSSQAVPGAGTCTIEVQFDPAAHGPQAANLTIPSNAASGSPTTISLQGSGVAPADATVSPSFGYFGSVTTGQAPLTQTFVLTNPGDNPLNISAATITGPDAAQFSIVAGQDSCSNQTVPGHSTCSITVALASAGHGPRQATLSIPSDAASGPVTTVGLAGDVLSPGVAFVNPSQQDFGSVTVGQSTSRTITLIDGGDEPLAIGQGSISGMDASDFSVVAGHDNCSTQSLSGGDSCTIVVQFAPTHTGAETASLSIPSNDPNSPAVVALTGTGQAPAAAPTPTPTPTPSPSPRPAPPTLTAPTLSGGGLTVQAGASDSRAQVTLQLSAAGTVHAAVKRDVNGQWVAAGSETLAAPKAGTVHLVFGPRLSGHPLAPGTYRVTVTASANGQASKPLNLRLTVKPPANGPHGQPRLLSVKLAPRTIVWGKGQPAPKLSLTFLLSRSATLQVAMQAEVNGTWRQVAEVTTHVKPGLDRVQLVGRWGGLLVPPRNVRLVVRASDASRQSVSTTFSVHIRHGKSVASQR